MLFGILGGRRRVDRGRAWRFKRCWCCLRSRHRCVRSVCADRFVRGDSVRRLQRWRELRPAGGAAVADSGHVERRLELWPVSGVRFDHFSLIEFRRTRSTSTLQFKPPAGFLGVSLGHVTLNESHADFTREFVIAEVRGLRSVLGSKFARRSEVDWRPILIDPEAGACACGTVGVGGVQADARPDAAGGDRRIVGTRWESRIGLKMPPKFDASIVCLVLRCNCSRGTRRANLGRRVLDLLGTPRGGMAEWSMAVVLKTTVPGRVPGVRIPLPPPSIACEFSGLR